MILPSAGTLISQSQVMDALNFAGTPQTNISLLYSSSIITASTATTTNALMYHNLAMGSGASQTAKQAIYDTFNAGTSFNFLNWGSYDSDPSITLTWTITNNNIDNNINGNIFIYDTSATQIWNYPFLVNAGGGTDNQTNYTTVQVSAINTKYLIALDATAFYTGPPPPPGGGVTGNTVSATDTDGVGGGTARFTFPILNFDTFNPLAAQRIINCTNNSVADIALNKRTSFDIVFN
jgi:hypothetical protein